MTTKPLQEPTFLILTALAGGPKHGYAVLRDVEALSDGRVTLRPGTLYTALDRLTAERLVEVEREEVTDGRLRRYYRITGAGATRLADEADRMRHNATAAIRHLKLGGLGA
jgi:DNA-binding PadR family transcriptional regulator